MGEYMAGELCDSGFFEGIDYLLPVICSLPDCVSEDITKVSFWRGDIMCNGYPSLYRCSSALS